jgi:glycosyltransferase involved in cell wall biosynthesis
VPATFSIVGRNPPESVRRHGKLPYVRVTGTVEDVRPFVARAKVCVVPLRIGGGTRIKIFEAMSMKKAVVSTSLGAEGLPVTHGEDILLADSPGDFADRVIELLQQPAFGQRLGEAGRRLVSSGFTWGAAAQRFSDICLEVVERRKNRMVEGR